MQKFEPNIKVMLKVFDLDVSIKSKKSFGELNKKNDKVL